MKTSEKRMITEQMTGGIKARDGLERRASSNLLVFPGLMPFEDTTHTQMAMAFQVNGGKYDGEKKTDKKSAPLFFVFFLRNPRLKFLRENSVGFGLTPE
jgi:hypothetical protein